jgi:hypothetical protein
VFFLSEGLDEAYASYSSSVIITGRCLLGKHGHIAVAPLLMSGIQERVKIEVRIEKHESKGNLVLCPELGIMNGMRPRSMDMNLRRTFCALVVAETPKIKTRVQQVHYWKHVRAGALADARGRVARR